MFHNKLKHTITKINRKARISHISKALKTNKNDIVEIKVLNKWIGHAHELEDLRLRGRQFSPSCSTDSTQTSSVE